MTLKKQLNFPIPCELDLTFFNTKMCSLAIFNHYFKWSEKMQAVSVRGKKHQQQIMLPRLFLQGLQIARVWKFHQAETTKTAYLQAHLSKKQNSPLFVSQCALSVENYNIDSLQAMCAHAGCCV